MRQVTFGDGADHLAFVLGWGNRPEHDGVSWLVDHFVDEGYRVTAFELPRTITDFEAEYLRPVADALAEFGAYRLLSHSTGGLVVRHLDDDAVTRTYMSPWWGFHPDLENPLVSLATKVPLARAVLPASATREELGELSSEEWVADAPDYAAPTFLREARRAQRGRPPFDDADAVFYNPDDPIVGSAAIEADVPAANRVAFAGGHELFNSRSRAEHLDALLAAVDGGAAALPG
jgi:hypothetical protein